MMPRRLLARTILLACLPLRLVAAPLERIDDRTAIDRATRELVSLPAAEAARAEVPRHAGPAALGSLADGYTACSLTQDNAFPFDLATGAVGLEIDLAPEARYPYDATMNPAETEVWFVGATGDGVIVVDRATNAIVARIPVGQYSIGIAFSHDGALALVTSRDDRLITIVDTATHQVTGTLPIPEWVGNITLDPVSHLFYAVHWYGAEVYEIAADGSALLRTATIGDSLWQLVTSPDGQYIYVTERDPALNLLRVLDRQSLSEIATVQVGDDPWGVDVTADGSTLVVVCEDDSVVQTVDAGSLTVTNTLPLPGDDPRDVDILNTTGIAYVPSGRTQVHLVDVATGSLSSSITVGCSSTNVVAVEKPLEASDTNPCPVPLVEASLVVGVKDLGDVALSWDAVAGASGYNVWRVSRPAEIPDARDPPQPFVTAVCPAIALAACTERGVVPDGQTYYYQVRAVCGGNEGP